MKNKKLTTYQMAVTALMAAALCVLGPLSVPIGAIPISLSNFVICLTAWLLGPKFGTLSVAVYLLIGLVGVPVFSGFTGGMGDSFGAVIGRWLVPVFAPIGLGFWQIVVALIAGISAKEVVVSSCAVLFGVVNASSPEGMAAFSAALEGIGFGPFNAFCLMVFCLLYIPCAATLATIRKESGSWAWMGFTAAFQLAVAWLVTFLVYQVGMFLF